MPVTLLPKHAPGMQGLDYARLLRRSPDPDAALSAVWRSRLPDRLIFGMPAGRHALWAFLEAVGMPHEGEVIVAGYNYFVVVRLLVQWGLTPIFIDIDADTLGMDPADLPAALTDRTRLVVVTHMFGNPVDIDRVLEICRPQAVPVFEDCAHAVGATDAFGQVGRRGDGALFSFGPQKLVNCFGGGMLVIDPALTGPWRPAPQGRVSLAVAASLPAKVLVSACLDPLVYRWTLHPLIRLGKRLARRGWPWLRDLASPSKDFEGYRFDPLSRPAFQPFMPDLCARQLDRLDRSVAARRRVVRRIRRRTRHLEAYRFLDEDRFGRANGAYFGVYVRDPEDFARFMLDQGVEVEPHEFYDCASLPQFAAFKRDCPKSRYASRHLARLPSYPALDRRRLSRLVRAMTVYARREAERAPPC